MNGAFLALRPKTLALYLVAGAILAIFGLFFAPKVQAAYSAGLLLDDVVLLDAGSMNAAQIQSFLTQKNSGLANMSFILDCDQAGAQAKNIYLSISAPCGQSISAANIIYYVSQIYGINPKVILATMQKEQSLVTAPNPTTYQLERAMGYGCPTTTGCQGASTFFYQIDNGAWVLRYHFERARGNNTWWNNNSNWTCGTEKNFYKPNLYPRQNVRFYDENGTQYTTVYIETAATSALYCYTPHAYNNPQGLFGRSPYGTTGLYYSGSYNFVSYFELWFGSVVSAWYYSCGLSGDNIEGATEGTRIISHKDGSGQPSILSKVQLNNTGSQCTEIHTWTTSMQQWMGHVATNLPAVNPTNAGVIFADTNGDGKDEAFLVDYQNNGSGRVEIHGWNTAYNHWVSHVASNHSGVSPANSEVIAGDTNGDGRDEFFLVHYRNNSSGKIEVHGWTPNLQGWVSHVATNHYEVDPANSRIMLADTNGDGRDEFFLVHYRNNSSGKIEVHGWTPNLQGWVSHVATNHYEVDPANYEVIAHDSNGDGRDELTLSVIYNSGSGRPEIHGWTSDLQGWVSHIAATP